LGQAGDFSQKWTRYKKPGNWTLIVLPVVEWHELELRKMTFQIANFAEL